MLAWQLLYASTADQEAEALEANGRPVPTYLYAPDVLPGFEPWLLAFWELSTDRQIGGERTGPIPAASIARECVDMEPDEAALFRRCIRALDRVYLAHLTNAAEKPKRTLQPGMLRGKDK